MAKVILSSLELSQHLFLAQKSQLQDTEDATTAIELDSGEVDAVCVEIISLREESQQITELLKLEPYYSREVIEQLRHDAAEDLIPH